MMCLKILIWSSSFWPGPEKYFLAPFTETFLLKLVLAMHNDLQFSKCAVHLHIYSVAYTVHFLDCPSSALPIRLILLPFSIVSSKIIFPWKPHLKKELSSPSQSHRGWNLLVLNQLIILHCNFLTVLIKASIWVLFHVNIHLFIFPGNSPER